MPISYLVDAARCLIDTRLWDSVTMTDLEAALNALYLDPEFNCDYNQLWNISELRAINLSPAAMKLESATPWYARTPNMAIVATPNTYAYGMARMFKTYADLDGRSVRIFRSAQEALGWLDSIKNQFDAEPQSSKMTQ
ncbi:MAG: hypothetical protein JXO72_03320 [Vicinamibacteria bacterium]|nr:hypothetical protein [Vicinamibacteria bacterium]